ncbi:MAG: hypothetical protein CMF65_09325 [Magnetovibrio sp.]|nr:hypothetical protein [Magnetovibrio sp.]
MLRENIFFLIIVYLIFLFDIQPVAAQTTTAQINLEPGAAFKDCTTCPEVIVVPRGIYIMGLGATRGRDGPPHRVNITRPFAIGRYEVTFQEWSVCVAESGCTHTPDDHNWGRLTRPVININWNQAKAFTKWLSTKTGHVYRLPSEAEWEYIHRAGTTTHFWWGDDVGKNRANCRDCESRSCCAIKINLCCSHKTKPIGAFLPNPFGVYDTAGNVFEWTEDCWNPNHKNAPTDMSARLDGDCHNRVIRGGSFYYFSKVARSYYRSKNPMNVKSYWLGFRVVRELIFK